MGKRIFDTMDSNIVARLQALRLKDDDLRVKSVSRSAQLDNVAEDTAGKIYNVEVQRADNGAVARRARYNLAMLDSHTLKKARIFPHSPKPTSFSSRRMTITDGECRSTRCGKLSTVQTQTATLCLLTTAVL